MFCKSVLEKFCIIAMLGICVPRLVRAMPNTELAKWNVVKVKPVYHDKTRKAFNDFYNLFRSLAEEFTRKDRSPDLVEMFEQLATYYKAQSESPWQESGWIYLPPGPMAFVITSKQIAGPAASVVLEFEGSRHAPISETSVIYTDPIYDIAIIGLDKSRLPSECTGFLLAKKQAVDASDVVSAGFASYDSDSTAFSVTHGIVSTAQLPGKDGVKYIAHTATFNQGSSGGPLLVETSPDELPGYSVLGMNIRQIADAATVNIAIPKDPLDGAIHAALDAQEVSQQNDRLKDALVKSANRLAVELGSSRPDTTMLSSLVSYTFVSQRPQVMAADLLKLLGGKMSVDERRRFSQSPVEYSRETLLRLFRETFATGDSNVDAVKFERITDDVSSGRQVRSVYKVAGKGQEIFWTWEHGAWRVADVSFDQGLQNRLKEIDNALRQFGVIMDLASGSISVTAESSSSVTKSDPEHAVTTKNDHSEPESHRERGPSVMIWASEDRRGAVADNFQVNLQRKAASSFGLEFAFPFNSNFWFSTGLGYGPMGVSYQVTTESRSLMIDEDPSYLQLPVLLRLEIPLETHYVTFRLFGKAGLTGDLLVQRNGTFYDSMTGSGGSLDDSNLNWFANHSRYNVSVLYGGGIEVGLGSSPSIYFGVEIISQEHLLKEWSSESFDDAANYRYQELRGTAFVKYQALH